MELQNELFLADQVWARIGLGQNRSGNRIDPDFLNRKRSILGEVIVPSPINFDGILFALPASRQGQKHALDLSQADECWDRSRLLWSLMSSLIPIVKLIFGLSRRSRKAP